MGRNVVTQCDSFSAKKLLQSGTNWDSFFVTKWDGSCYKVGQVLQSETELLQIEAGVTKWDGRCYKMGQVLKSVTIVTKWALTTIHTSFDTIDIWYAKINIGYIVMQSNYNLMQPRNYSKTFLKRTPTGLLKLPWSDKI